MSEFITIPVENLEDAISFFTEKLHFRLQMIQPADEPSVAVLSGHGCTVRFEISRKTDAIPADGAFPRFHLPIVSRADEAKWVAGRAGMEYRDLIPGRLGGRLVASLIRLNAGGEVADYVHYHKIAFQMIYCWHGRVKIVYEDQGEPFWLHPGDCVLQPPGIRHRVLECAAGSQVVELTSPAVHETWAEHELTLPNGVLDPDRDFDGQRFVHRKAVGSTPVFGEFGDFETHPVGGNGAAYVYELRTDKDHSAATVESRDSAVAFYFALSGRLTVSSDEFPSLRLNAGDAIVVPPKTVHELRATANSEILAVII